MFNSRWLIHTAEGVVAAFIAAFMAAASQLPGGVWNSNNWKVAAVAAFGIAVKSVFAKKIGDPNSPALLPSIVEKATAGTVGLVTGSVEKVLDSTVGKVPIVGPVVDQTVESVDNIVETTAGGVVGGVTGLVSGLTGIFKRKK